MKLNNQHFNSFKAECEEWLDKFELNRWDVVYTFKPMNGTEACADSQPSSYFADITLNKELTNIEKSENVDDYLKNLAKHEVLHILISRFSGVAKMRYINERELDDEEEGIVNLLTKII